MLRQAFLWLIALACWSFAFVIPIWIGQTKSVDNGWIAVSFVACLACPVILEISRRAWALFGIWLSACPVSCGAFCGC